MGTGLWLDLICLIQVHLAECLSTKSTELSSLKMGAFFDTHNQGVYFIIVL